jgi:general secretion pathway protein C
MESILRRHIWAIDGIVIVVCMIFLARATSTIAARRLLMTEPAHALAPPRTVEPVPAKQVDDILRRNIFCSTCPPIGAESGLREGPAAPAPLRRTSLNLKLLAIMFAPRPADPRWSVAIIRDNDAKSAGPHNVGSRLRGATIDDIVEDRVYLDFGEGRREYLDLLDRPEPPPTSASATTPTVAADPLAAELDRGVKKLGEHSYEVQRSTLDALLGNMPALAISARIVPENKNGKPAGFRLFSIRPDGPFAKLGLQNGDLVSAINGLDMTSPDEALLAYTKLKTANHLSIAIERGGHKLTKDYNIR